MGRTYRPKYRIEAYELKPTTAGKLAAYKSVQSWPNHKPATEAELETWRKGRNASMKPGGANEQIPAFVGYVPHVYRAALIEQSTGAIVATTVMPMFEVA